jgi:hypothetical protein
VVGDSHALAQDDEVVTVEPERQPLSVQAMLRDDSHAESWRRVLEHLKRRRLSTGWRRAGLTARLMSDLYSRCGWREDCTLRRRAYAQSSEPRCQAGARMRGPLAAERRTHESTAHDRSSESRLFRVRALVPVASKNRHLGGSSWPLSFGLRAAP